MRLLLKLIILIAKIVRDKICNSMRMTKNHKIYSKITMIMKVNISKIWGSRWYFNKILSLMLMINKKTRKKMRMGRTSKKIFNPLYSHDKKDMEEKEVMNELIY